ncbi:hypothetical protein PHYBLDRAFT_62767 [Phycomyces blakesleeanus NRRL 1555(-)]|uniref:Uncharacterized protein n=1 Tax=Phycomyces blakesleeanus (strain ATCC 8743b / DSM 1359 / FGSC 10004 / NBRC 33097 / NRRL 1555) TaxID=763407 RepID=A0A163B643_PHYB8|nr:hypothetical protein PHYBLDRAFT_62767 [Phycomyces blakesleeanus NRRL 1555(-)]OAD78471.1 hypothetical protein PHYBLDRAFT_62767 [Phycomyces blakesleeanus NRRL 1555(-)]|eukprot:XP_018296511.1 hypothetical protein PHYBLDRAFT_62767 [Phycomyces blakesleeanus NRRL 1555(-)]
MNFLLLTNQVIQRDQEADKGRLHDLQAQLQEKTKQFHKLQSMYEKLKRKTAIPNLQQSIPPSLQFPPHPPHIGPTPYVGHPMPPPTNQPYQYPHPYPQNAYWTPPQNFLSDPRASPLQSIHNTAQSTRTYTTLGSTVSQPPYNSAYQNKQHPNKPRQNSPVHPTSNNNPASTRDPKQI